MIYILSVPLFFLATYVVFVVISIVSQGMTAKRLGKEAAPFCRILDDSVATVMIIGDSTAIGTGASDPSQSIAGRLAADFPKITVVNNGVNGISTKNLSGILSKHPEWKADLIIIHISGIDVLGFRSLRSCGRNITAILAKANAMAPKVVLLTSSNLGTIPFSHFPLSILFSRRTKFVRDFVLRRVKRGDFAFVDLYDDPKSDPLLKNTKRFFAKDGIHPTGDGYKIWYDRLKSVLTDQGWTDTLEGARKS